MKSHELHPGPGGVNMYPVETGKIITYQHKLCFKVNVGGPNQGTAVKGHTRVHADQIIGGPSRKAKGNV